MSSDSVWEMPEHWTDLPHEPWLKPDARGVYRVPLNVDAPSGLRRRSHPVTSGVPLPEGSLTDAKHARVVDEQGRELALQTQALARWPGGSVKWLLLDFQLDLTPRQSRRLWLEFGPGIHSAAQHPRPVHVRASAGCVTIGNGVVELGVDPTAPGLPSTLEWQSASPLRGPIRGVFTARSTEGRRDGFYVTAADGKLDVKIEETGPMRAVVRLSGWHVREDGRRSMQFIARLTVWAGLPIIGIQHTFIVTDDTLTTFFRGVGLTLPVTQGGRYEETEDGVALVHGDTTVGALVRDRRLMLPKQNAFDRATSTLGIYLWPLDGPEMDLRPALVRRPPEMLEWIKQYPDEFDRIEGGPLTQEEAIEAFAEKKPISSMGDMRARTGMGTARTHDVFIGAATDADAVLNQLRAFDKPLFAFVSPQYYSMTRAMGTFHPYDPANFPEVERCQLEHANWLLRHAFEWSHWTGFFDYGDTLSVYDVKRKSWWLFDGGRWGWLNGEVNSEQGWVLLALRTCDRKWLDFAEAAARHRIDCDQLHYHDKHPNLVGGLHRHYMTEHWTGVIDGGHLWTDGGVNLYYLFGMRRGLECAVEGADWAINYGMPMLIKHAETTRETANCLRSIARAYEATGDPKYHEAAEAYTRGYLCCFDDTGASLTLEECQARLRKEFEGTKWWDLPEQIEYTWHGHVGWGYLGYSAPAVAYWAEIGRTPDALKLANRYDYSGVSIQGHPGQLLGEMYFRTGDVSYLAHLLRDPQMVFGLPARNRPEGDRPDSFLNPRVDHLHGTPYLMAALYHAREKSAATMPKPSAKPMGYRAVGSVVAGDSDRRTISFDPVDLSGAANADSRHNAFGYAWSHEDMHRLPDLKPGQIGFQFSKGNEYFREGFRPVSAYHVYPTLSDQLVPNLRSVCGLPFGATVEYAGVPWQFPAVGRSGAKAVVVVPARGSVTIPLRGKARAIHLLGQVFGKLDGSRISQFRQLTLGWYDVRYKDGASQRVELVNGKHCDSLFSEAFAGEVEHAATMDWAHVFSNMTLDRLHFNRLRLPIEDRELESITLRSSDVDWRLLLAAATLERAGKPTEPIRQAMDLGAAQWEDVPGWYDVKDRRRRHGDGVELRAPARLRLPVIDGRYEVLLTVSGDPAGKPRLRVMQSGRHLVQDYCLAGNGRAESLRFIADAHGGSLVLDISPAPNSETIRNPDKGYRLEVVRYAGGNFTRIEGLALRRLGECAPVPPGAAAIEPYYGLLRAQATGQTSIGGLVMDYGASNDSQIDPDLGGGGFRADVPTGRYRVWVSHCNYARLGSVIVELAVNGRKAIECETEDGSHQFDTEVTDGRFELTWRQPRVHCRCPFYSLRAVVLTPLDS